MIVSLKSIVKKVFYVLTGKFKHLKVAVRANKKWYGNHYGGFFVCPDLLNENSIVYSFGIGEDISFDDAILKNHKCFVFAFDPTPKSIEWIKKEELPSGFTFFEYGISQESGFIDFYLPKNKHHVSGSFIHQSNVDEKQVITVEMKSLDDIAATLGHKKIDVIKMDIEGAEYRVLESVLKSGVKIDQILVEFHERFFEDGVSRTTAIVEMMNKHGFRIFGISNSFDEVSFINTESLTG